MILTISVKARMFGLLALAAILSSAFLSAGNAAPGGGGMCDAACLQKKALLGDGLIAYQIGNSFLYKDRQEMMRWYRISAENGNVSGQYNYAHFLARDSDSAEDCYRAIFWFSKAASLGHKSSKEARDLLLRLSASSKAFKAGCASEYSP